MKMKLKVESGNGVACNGGLFLAVLNMNYKKINLRRTMSLARGSFSQAYAVKLQSFGTTLQYPRRGYVRYKQGSKWQQKN